MPFQLASVTQTHPLRDEIGKRADVVSAVLGRNAHVSKRIVNIILLQGFLNVFIDWYPLPFVHLFTRIRLLSYRALINTLYEKERDHAPLNSLNAYKLMGIDLIFGQG